MISRGAALIVAVATSACPSSRDNGSGGTAPGTASAVAAAPAPALHASATVLASATPQPETDLVVPLLAGEPLPSDTVASDSESAGAELLFEIRPRSAPGIPVHLGAVMPAVTSAQNLSSGVLRVTVAAGRVRVRVGPRAFALDDGWELRGDRGRGGFILLLASNQYRVVPSGALRTLLSERRIDVMPLGPTHLARIADGSHLGRTTTRTRVTTAWGSLDLDQMTVSPPAKSASGPRGDARSDAPELENTASDGGGEPLCRMFLELVGADRALGGAPCSPSLIPLRAEISFAVGGGIAIDAASVREGAVARSELAFPPTSAQLSTQALPEAKFTALGSDVLLSLRAKGEPAPLEVANKSPAPRWLFIDGVAVALFPSGAERSLSLRPSRYVLEWRTPLGEILERASEVNAPGRASVAQWVPPPLSSASPIASARNGP